MMEQLGIGPISRMNHHSKRAPAAESNDCEVMHVARCQATHAEQLGERYDRAIHEAQAEIRETSVHFHRT
jgi:hypothetical protein